MLTAPQVIEYDVIIQHDRAGDLFLVQDIDGVQFILKVVNHQAQNSLNYGIQNLKHPRICEEYVV